MDRWFDPLLETAPDAGPQFCRLRKSVKHDLLISVGSIQKSLVTDPSKLMVQSVISTPMKDLQGDVINPDGLDTSYHEQLRVVLYDHGQNPDIAFPVGKSEDPNGNYTVKKAGDRWIADTYFARNKMGEDIFDLIESDILRGWSLTMIPTMPGVPLGPVDKSLRRSPMRFDGMKMTEYGPTPNPINPESLTIVAQKGRLHNGPFDPRIMKSLQKYLPEGTATIVVPDHPLVSKAMGEESGTDDGEEMAEPTHTAKTSYDGAQGMSDICDHLEQELMKCEHIKGKKNLKKCIDHARELVEELKANGDMVSSDLDDSPDEQDKMVDEPEPVKRSADGLILIKKAKYEGRRWTSKDVAEALAKTPDPEPDQTVRRKSRADRQAEREAEKKKRILDRINQKYGQLAAV